MTKQTHTPGQHIAHVGKCEIIQELNGNYAVFHSATGICQGLFSSPVNAYKHAESVK